MRPKWIQVTHRSRPCCPCSRPVRRTEPSLRGALATKQSSFCETTRKKLDCFAALAMTVLLQKYLRPRRANAPEVCHELSRHWNQRARGMPDARCTRGLACKKWKKTHTSIQVQRRTSDIPCAMALRLITRSPRRRIRLVTVIGELTEYPRPVGPTLLRRFDTSNGCRNHTTSPYAATRLRQRLRRARRRSSARC
jgi:hypothetical protein